MGEIDSFGKSQRKGCIVIATLIVLLIGAVLFFSLGEFKTSGIFRSGKSSDATELYQLYPVAQQGTYYFVAVEGVFKTKIYNRQGGITMRSGSTDVRLSIYDLSQGQMIKREVNGEFHEGQIKILGYAGNVLWTYEAEKGIQSMSIPDLQIKTTQENIIAANTDLSAGLAKTDEYFGNFDELYAFSEKENAIFVTTVDGKQIWIDATTFQSRPPVAQATNLINASSAITDMFYRAAEGEPLTEDYINSIVRSLSIDISSSHFLSVLNTQAIGADSCTYSLDGSTIKKLTKSNCPQPAVVEAKAEKNTFIDPVFLSAIDPVTKQYTNPDFLSDTECLLLHAAKMGDKVDLLLSLVNVQTQKPKWTIKTGITLNNYRTSYHVNALFGYNDTMLLAVNDQLFSIKVSAGKINWSVVTGTTGYDRNLFYIGIAEKENRKYILAANSYFTELSRDGIFVNGRTDYRMQCIDATTGKVMKKQEVRGGASQDLPFYLGMSDNKCWFFTQKDGIHTRSIPDMKIVTTFAEIKKNAPAEIDIVNAERFGDALNDNYVILNEQQHAIYLTTQNGLHYAVNTATLQVTEIENPSDRDYEKWQDANTKVDFYRTMIHNYYHHELTLRNGGTVKIEELNSIGKLIYKENKPEQQNTAAIASDQFIEGNIIMNGVSVDGNTILFDNNKTPLLVTKNDPSLFIMHKDKIAPDAHLIISKYDTKTEQVNWKYDVSQHFTVMPELERVYTLQQTIICIFKSHPDLDDNFTAIALDAGSGKEIWNFKF